MRQRASAAHSVSAAISTGRGWFFMKKHFVLVVLVVALGAVAGLVGGLPWGP
jgi:hypothetical protein